MRRHSEWQGFREAESQGRQGRPLEPDLTSRPSAGSDGAPAPKGESRIVSIPAEAAQRLAYYKAERGFGVLGPRGWHCFGIYGSNGDSLHLTPHPIDPSSLFSTDWTGIKGPAIQIDFDNGDTSGRFRVARIIARVFPSRRAFVKSVIREGIAPGSSFPFSPYPKDKLTYKGKEIVEYQTPAQTDGLGTQSRLQKDESPIAGVAILMGETPDLLFLAVRLPADLSDLTPIIIQQVESQAAHVHR